MTRQIPFTKYEAALLLDAYLKVLSGELSRMDSVKECSRLLRLMAINSGMRIDDIYRNKNGISFQMASMESAYQGRTIMKPATRLFAEVVNLYKNDNKKYLELLKAARDKCLLDYENFAITNFEREIAMDKRDRTQTQDQTERQYYRDDKESFFQWLRENQHLAEATCRSYASAIRSAEKFAEEHGITTRKLYTKDLDEAKATADSLFANPEFIQYNNDQHNRFRAAITKLLTFYGSNWEPIDKTDSVSELKSGQPSDTKLYCSILVERFPKGYRLGSTLDMKRFRRYYEEQTGLPLTLEQAKVGLIIRKCGIVYDGRLFMPQTMLSVGIKEQVIAFIEKCLDEGRSAVYYEALFREFSEAFLDHQIFNAEMLKAYLNYYVGDKYYIGRSYLSKETRAEIDPIDEVRQCLKQHDTPMKVDGICDILSHIAKDRVRYILRANGEFVRNSKGEYFHADALDLTDEELENIAEIIDLAIEEHVFISGNELYDAIQKKYPYTFEKNVAFSMIGWRDALKHKIGDRFSFVGNIVSRRGTSLSMSDVFSEYGKGRLSFTIEELEQFADSIGTTIYFDSLYNHALRISHKEFVAKKNVRFSIKETDSVLERLCEGNYMPLSSVKEFAIFPNASYPWTEYLLEQYVAYFSEKFYLCHGNYNKNCAVGAIVKRSCQFNSFDELVTDILAHGDIPLQKKEVLDYLAETGYIARRSYTNIEAIVINARAKRNLKEKK